MEFRTELQLKKSPRTLDLKDSFMTLGSCFSETMGQRLTENKFNTVSSPFGSTYHPISIHRHLKYLLFQELPSEHSYLQKGITFLNYDFHSKFFGDSIQYLKRKLTDTIGVGHFFLSGCNVLLLTYGTSWIYERNDTGEPVANCHKEPGAQFAKRLTGTDEIISSFTEAFLLLKKFNPEIRVILTVSPVRHIKDTLQLNSVSKAILRVACQEIVNNHEGVEYFPSFEIMMDDLRDYRFYKEDLIHPSEVAENYIWEKFSGYYFNSSTLSFIEDWTEIRRAIQHRPFNERSQDHQKFVAETLSKLGELKSRINVDQEVEYFRKQLA